MYLTSLPDHSHPGFNEASHFRRFKEQNVIFNTLSRTSYCDEHVGCLSFKTILYGEEWYGIDNRRLAIRPGQFLILNDEQNYSCRINSLEHVQGFSVFFQNEFASEIFRNTLKSDLELLEDPFCWKNEQPFFFQTLHTIGPDLQLQLNKLIKDLQSDGYHAGTEEQLVFLLRYLIKTLREDSKRSGEIAAIKPASKNEIFKRVCIARDVLHSTFMEQMDLKVLSTASCLSVPQLIRQFKSVFNVTPHQYLVRIRLEQAAALLKNTKDPINEITWACGFENVSAFCRAFKNAYGKQPLIYRQTNS
jgi:AraC family transcriptional regulator